MPQQAWSKKRERQYDKIKKSELDRGRDEDTAEEIASRTVNKERARSGESRQASRTSTKDISSGRRGGKRSGTAGPKGRTKEQLYEEARKKNIQGRSSMNKAQLARAVGRCAHQRARTARRRPRHRRHPGGFRLPAHVRVVTGVPEGRSPRRGLAHPSAHRDGR
jgi:hypothetical protein